jgi:hypothetical protein
MSAARLQEYISLYDVDLCASVAIMEGDMAIGLGMLGSRPGRGWITRVGVLPAARRRGLGRLIVAALLENAAALGHRAIWLEVIKGNEPALKLFEAHGFRPTRELIVARRAPSPSPAAGDNSLGVPLAVRELDRPSIDERLARRADRPNWLNEAETMCHIAALAGLWIKMPGGRGEGWVSYRLSAHQLNYVLIEVEAADPGTVAACTLGLLHSRYATLDAVIENLPADSACWPGYQDAGYFETFRRVEMVLHLDA